MRRLQLLKLPYFFYTRRCKTVRTTAEENSETKFLIKTDCTTRMFEIGALSKRGSAQRPFEEDEPLLDLGVAFFHPPVRVRLAEDAA